jgi:hypothetical protein
MASGQEQYNTTIGINIPELPVLIALDLELSSEPPKQSKAYYYTSYKLLLLLVDLAVGGPLGKVIKNVNNAYICLAEPGQQMTISGS